MKIKRTISLKALEGAADRDQGGAEWEDIEKALGHKYIRRWPSKSGKGYDYLYPKDFLKPLNALKLLFGVQKTKIEDEYEKNEIKKEYGADKKTFAAHVLEYLSNKLKWNEFFTKKENRAATAKPVKMKVAQAEGSKLGSPQSELSFDKKPKATDNKISLNRSLMRKVYNIYNKSEAEQNEREDNAGSGLGELPNGVEPVRGGGSEKQGDLNVPSAGNTSDPGQSTEQSDKPGIGPGKPIPGRRGRSSIKEIRKQILALLAEKTDSEMTEADKDLLRQYEGAGGISEKDRSVHGTLYEFYTPQKVVDKVWSLVDKYKPRLDKDVLEPSAGTGRFAEGRKENFTLCELDKTSSRIAGILHPEAEIKQGYFQELFMDGNTPKKKYDGKKFDVVIGNPPFGAYSGLHRGLGEGKEHTRIEEYFIDRSLNTMKDGAILAMVVPSSFLRGKNSKAKMQIAKKGKLIEAWRLPNGTFGTTTVGTDIILIRKEPGDSMDYQNDIYFQKNEENIAGIETDRQGKFGMEKYVSPPDGMNFDQALESINPAKVPVVEIGELPPSERIEVKETDGEKHDNRSRGMKGNDNAAGSRGGKEPEKRGKKQKKGDQYTPSTGKNMTSDEFNSKYGRNIPQEEIPIWKATDIDGKIDVSLLSPAARRHLETSGNFTVDAEGSWMAVLNYASGNIYAKLEQLETDKELIVRTMGEDVYKRNKELLEAVIPPPKKAENFIISPISDFAKEYKIKDDDEKLIDLREAFVRWAQVKKSARGDVYMRDDSPISQYEIPKQIRIEDVIDFVLQRSVKLDSSYDDKGTQKMEQDLRRRLRRETAERLFNRFIQEGMTIPQREALEKVWNNRFNAIAEPDYRKIPLFIEGMNTHKGDKKFDLLDQQIKGISFVCNKGNGVLAYDVGVGKTACGIAATVNQIQTGRAKKPLICVPKSVYKKWIKEIHQHFPNIVVNDLGNLNKKSLADFKTDDNGLNIQEGSISICTYEALSNITFKSETMNGDLAYDMMDSQSIHDEGVEDTRTDVERAKEMTKIEKLLGDSSKTEAGSNAVYWENTGFDHITVDELHNFKNVFAVPRSFSHSNKLGNKELEEKKEKGEIKRQSNEYSGIAGSTPSGRAMKLFAITQLIQQKNGGRNIFGLSATPFTNSPIEIYNILSLVARKKLKDLHIYNMYEFLNQFAELKDDMSVKPNGEIEEKQVMKKFKNLTALQNLLTEFLDKVDGEEAGVVRPRKKPHKPELELSAMQKAIIKIETDRINNASKDDPGAALVAMNNMRTVTLSPTLIDPKFLNEYKEKGIDISSLKPENIVTESPKLKFVCDSIIKAWKENSDNGQLIYMPRGTEQYDFVKKYLVGQGMPPEAIAFYRGDESLDKREQIKDDFNDENGTIKVIIGSEAMKEGVSLNGNSMVLYNTMLGWNPTETIQVEGRIHRQGNKQGHVHIVYPLMNDSIDAFMYQKYDEKSSRLNDLWSYKGDSLIVDEIDPQEMKFALIKDPKKRAKLKIDLMKEEVENNQRIEEANYDVLFKTRQNLTSLENDLPGIKENMQEYEMATAKTKSEVDSCKELLKAAKKAGKDKYEIKDLENDVENAEWDHNQKNTYYKMAKQEVKNTQDQIIALKSKLRRQGLITPEDIEKRLKDYSSVAQKYKKEIEEIKGKFNEYVEEARKDIEKTRKKVPPLEEQINENVRAIMDNLRPMSVVKEEIREERGLAKSILIISKRWIKA